MYFNYIEVEEKSVCGYAQFFCHIVEEIFIKLIMTGPERYNFLVIGARGTFNGQFWTRW